MAKPVTEQPKPRGYVNLHTHGCRWNTARRDGKNQDQYWSHRGMSVAEIVGMPLPQKQFAMGILHQGLAYTTEDLTRRMRRGLKLKLRAGETEVWMPVDTSPDIGRRAIDVAIAMRAEFEPLGLKVRVGGYPIHGLKSPGSDRYELLREVASEVDFFVGLPERDTRPGHEQVGFDGHLQIMLELAHEFHKPFQCHVDQMNHPNECGTETLIEAVRWLGSPKVDWLEGPTVFGVHGISTAAYDDSRHDRLLDNLLEYNIAMIVCQKAGLSMRQPRPVLAPTHNSSFRVREALARGIRVGAGDDNIGDIFVPTDDMRLISELPFLENVHRFYDMDVWDKVLRYQPLDNIEMGRVQRSLDDDRLAFEAL